MDLCRSCMSGETSKLQPLFKTKRISIIFKRLTLLNVSKDDDLPKWLCTDCIDMLNSFDSFKKQCIKSNKLLKEKLEKANEEHIPETVEVMVDINNCEDDIDIFKDDDFNLDDDDFAKNDENTVVHLKYEIDNLGGDQLESKIVDEESKSLVTTDDPNEFPSNSIKEEQEPVKTESDPVEEKIKIKLKPLQPPKRLRKKKFKPMEYDKIQEHAFYFRCYICNRGFRYKERFEGHLREHEGKRAAVCEFCNREYTEWSGLQKHINLVHNGEMKYICQCGKKFMYESALNTHKLVHDGPREYVCEWCGKSFIGSSKLRKHMLVHTDETPFTCQLCGKKFKSVQRLRNHQIRHTDMKRFPCDVCGKAFTTRPELRTHFITHSDIKPYKCSVCEELFRHKTQLYLHRKSHMTF